MQVVGRADYSIARKVPVIAPCHHARMRPVIFAIGFVVLIGSAEV